MHKQNWLRKLAPLAALLLLGALLTACASGSKQAVRAPVASPAERKGMDAAAPGSGPAQASAPQAAKPASQPASGQAASNPPGGGSGTGVGAVGPDATFNRKIILNADVSLKVKDARAALQEIQDLVNFNRGYVADANLTGSDEGGWNGRLVLRIPSANYGNVMEKMRQLGEVRQERQWSQDVTEQYIDLEARVKILTEHEQRLRELALKANTFDEWLKLTQQVNDTRIQIENLTGRLRLLSNQVEFSTINISLIQPPPGKDEEPKPANLTERMARAFRESAKGLAALGEGLLIFLAGFLPVGVVLGAVAAAVIMVVRTVRRATNRVAPPPVPPPADGN